MKMKYTVSNALLVYARGTLDVPSFDNEKTEVGSFRETSVPSQGAC